MEHKYSYEELLSIVRDLRGENGCPWDRVQTHESMKTCLIEECYEVIEAIDKHDDENLAEELGDVLLQVVMHSQIAAEESRFAMADVVDELCRKLVRRHPHVFGGEEAGTPAEGLEKWEAIKQQEKQLKKEPQIKGELEAVPNAFPALIRAQKVQKKASKKYGHAVTIDDICTQIRSQLKKIEQKADFDEKTDFIAEAGRLLFATVDLIRILGLNAENSLTNATETFINKFEGEMDKHIKPL